MFLAWQSTESSFFPSIIWYIANVFSLFGNLKIKDFSFANVLKLFFIWKRWMEKYSEMKSELSLCGLSNGKSNNRIIRKWGQDTIQAYVINTVKEHQKRVRSWHGLRVYKFKPAKHSKTWFCYIQLTPWNQKQASSQGICFVLVSGLIIQLQGSCAMPTTIFQLSI